MKSFYIFLFLLCIFSCKQKSSDDQANLQIHSGSHNSVKSNFSFSVLDSLQKYSGADSVYLEKDNVRKMERLFISKANDAPFGVRMVYDDTNSFIIFYQKIKNEWKSTDTIENKEGRGCNFRRVDLNGDNLKDLRISLVEGAHGNYQSIVYLFYPKTRSFKNNIYYDLLNVEYDTVHKFVRSSIYASAAGCQDKMKYKIVADSLVFDLGITYCPDDKQPGENASLEYYKMHNGDRIITKSRRGNPEKLWKEFEHAFWDSSNE